MRLRLSMSILLLSVSFGGCALLETEIYTNPDYTPSDLGYLQIRMPKIPRMPASDWLNASPGITDSLRGKVVLFDFWDYTCVNCLRTLPYLREWYRRYAKDGLVIIGVHTPEFAFAGKRKNLSRAVERLRISYPVVMDNHYLIWKEFGNDSWPHEYLFGRKGLLRYAHIGEGEYGNTERMIQTLLKDGHPKLAMPPVMKPARPTDVPGAVCYLPTAETYLGYGRGNIGNTKGYRDNRVVTYILPKSISDNRFYLVGKWYIRRQYVRYAGVSGEEGKLILSYAAASVNLVARADYAPSGAPEKTLPVVVYVYLDGLPVPKDDRTAGMMSNAAGKTYITITVPKMYELIKSKKFERHILTLEPRSDAFAAYSFTFGTTCAP